MPGYLPLKYNTSQETLASKEPIYAQLKTTKRRHPLFDDLKSKQNAEMSKFERMLKYKEMQPSKSEKDFNFDSLKLLGAQSDSSYLDSFMNSGSRSRHPSATDPNDAKNRPRSITKSASTVFGKGQKNSGHSDTALQLAMLSSLRSVASEGSIYQSVEMIHYLKAKKSYDREKKTKYCQKTGHPLFDHLREEQALRTPTRKIKSKERILEPIGQKGQHVAVSRRSSTGNSPSQSSSSGDEYESFSGGLVMKKLGPKTPTRMERNFNDKLDEKENLIFRQKVSEEGSKHGDGSSESEEDFRIIPRPRLVKLMRYGRRTGETLPSDESDSSAKSTGLR